MDFHWNQVSCFSAIRNSRMVKQVVQLSCVFICTLTCGCPNTFESNIAACKRVLRYTFECEDDGTLSPEQLDATLTLFCDDVPETSECNTWSAYADCITDVPCDDNIISDPCLNLLPPAECLPSCGSFGSTFAIMPLALVGTRFVRRRHKVR